MPPLRADANGCGSASGRRASRVGDPGRGLRRRDRAAMVRLDPGPLRQWPALCEGARAQARCAPASPAGGRGGTFRAAMIGTVLLAAAMAVDTASGSPGVLLEELTWVEAETALRPDTV